MRRVFKSSSVAFAAIGLVAVGSLSAMAQSGSRNYPPSRSSGRTAVPAGSEQTATAAGAPFAMEGYCPVSILEMEKWVKGDPAHRVLYDGWTYLFANQKGKQMFQANPAKYVPALGGDCVVALVKMKQARARQYPSRVVSRWTACSSSPMRKGTEDLPGTTEGLRQRRSSLGWQVARSAWSTCGQERCRASLK